MRRSIRLMLLLALGLLVALVAAPVGSAATGCQKGKERKLGATYVTKLTTKNATCATARTVVKAFHSCRKKKGLAGYCKSKVKGYTCTERRPAAERIATQYTGYVTCKSATRRVIQEYQQNT
jgi:hypothetical protein